MLTDDTAESRADDPTRSAHGHDDSPAARRSPRARVEHWLGRDALAQYLAYFDDRLDEMLGGQSGDPPPGAEVVALDYFEWPGDPSPDYLCVVRHPFPCGPAGETLALTMTGTSRGWRLLEGADVSPASAYQQTVVADMYDRGLWVIEAVEGRPSSYDRLFAGWPEEPLADLRVRAVAELAPALGGPAATAHARRGGEWGWAVTQGGRTGWYPATGDGPCCAVGALGRFVAFEILGLGRSRTA